MLIASDSGFDGGRAVAVVLTTERTPQQWMSFSPGLGRARHLSWGPGCDLGRVFINAQMSGLMKGSDAGRLKDGAARSAAGIRTLHNSGLPSVEQAFV